MSQTPFLQCFLKVARYFLGVKLSAPAILFLRSDLIFDPILFSHFLASEKVGSDLKIRSDIKNKIAGTSGKF